VLFRQRLVTHQKKLSAKKAKDARRNGRSIALFSRIWSSRQTQSAAQSRVAKQILGSASGDATSSLKTDAV